MDDTKSLLMMVLHKIFQNHPKIIENTFQLIHSFNNGKIDKRFYEKTLKSICDLLNDELPSPILVYILTLVDMPENYDSQSKIVEKMKKTHDHLPEINVRPHLLEFLNNLKQSPTLKQKKKTKEEETMTQDASQKRPKPLKKAKKLVLKQPETSKSLLDVCANYIIKNKENLNRLYARRQLKAWRLINSNVLSGSDLEMCYKVVEDLNRKNKLLRQIESGNITTELLMEEYKDVDVFLKNNSPENDDSRFQNSPEFEAALQKMFNF